MRDMGLWVGQRSSEISGSKNFAEKINVLLGSEASQESTLQVFWQI